MATDCSCYNGVLPASTVSTRKGQVQTIRNNLLFDKAIKVTVEAFIWIDACIGFSPI